VAERAPAETVRAPSGVQVDENLLDRFRVALPCELLGMLHPRPPHLLITISVDQQLRDGVRDAAVVIGVDEQPRFLIDHRIKGAPDRPGHDGQPVRGCLEEDDPEALSGAIGKHEDVGACEPVITDLVRYATEEAHGMIDPVGAGESLELATQPAVADHDPLRVGHTLEDQRHRLQDDVVAFLAIVQPGDGQERRSLSLRAPRSQRKINSGIDRVNVGGGRTSAPRQASRIAAHRDDRVGAANGVRGHKRPIAKLFGVHILDRRAPERAPEDLRRGCSDDVSADEDVRNSAQALIQPAPVEHCDRGTVAFALAGDADDRELTVSVVLDSARRSERDHLDVDRLQLLNEATHHEFDPARHRREVGREEQRADVRHDRRHDLTSFDPAGRQTIQDRPQRAAGRSVVRAHATHTATRPVRMLVVAPFSRDKEQGGSQRATALAERMEERGVQVGWHVVNSSPRSKRSKAARMLRLEPALVGGFPRRAFRPEGRWDLALAAHSFLAPQLAAVASGVPRVIDFHNLEWQHLSDSASLERTSAGRRGLIRDSYLAAQIRLLRRFEQAVLRTADLSLLVSDAELSWADAVRLHGSLLLVPSVLPRSTERAALEIAGRRRPGRAPRFVYVGTLTFPPNVMSLRRFLHASWPAIVGAWPNAELTIVGGCEDALRAELQRQPGVRALGYVEDLAPLLEPCSAAIMPFDGRAGTSLRILFYALARVPVLGSPEAFRGMRAEFGVRASTPREWVDGARALVEAPASGDAVTAHRLAIHRQNDPEPWDDLHRTLLALARRRPLSGIDRDETLEGSLA
jgi:hypothetical protein